MASLIPHHRRSTRTRREPKRFTDEKFVSGRVDQYTRGYSGWHEDRWRNKYQDAENYYHDHRNRKFGSVSWTKKNKYHVNLRDFPESLLEFSSIWRDFGYEMPDVVLDKIGSFLNISSTDQALLVDDDAFITADHEEECEEIDHSDEESMTDGEFYSSEDDEGWSASEDEDEDNIKCKLKRKEPSSPTKVSFSSSDDEVHETYSTREYNRTNFDFYDAIRRRDRVDEKWRRIIMRVYGRTLR